MPKPPRHVRHAAAIGRTLKMWRERRGMSLRDVMRHSKGLAEHVGFDYLSRLERGELMPSVPKLAALATIYEKPISELIDQYEIEELRRFVPKRAGYELLRKLGIEALKKGEITKACACFLGALDAARREGADRQHLAVALNNVGCALMKGGRYLTAQRYLEEGTRLVESPMTRARLFDNLATVHYQLDNLVVAELYSRDACALAADDPAVRPDTRATRATVLFDLGRPVEAEQLMREAIEDYERAGNEVSAIRQTYNLGHCLVLQEKTEEGLGHLRLAVARAAGRRDLHLRATSLMFLGRCFYKIGRKDEAEGPLKEALLIADREANRNAVFGSAYYLWRISRERGKKDEEAAYEMIVRRYRFRLEQRSEEAREFDSWLQANPGASIGRPRKAAAFPDLLQR